jgi:tape measure domain-containing protein
MARTVDELLIKIKADTKELEKKLKNIKGELDTTGKTGIAAFGGAGLAGAMSKIPKAAIGVTAALVGIGTAVGSVARVGAGFEDLKDSLDTVFGSMAAGDVAMDKVFKFAQTTPFQIEDATKAFIQLRAVGVEPNMDMLQTFADVASTSIDQLGAFQTLVRVVQRSASGGLGLEELNQLDERGIPAIKILTTELGMSKEELTKFGKTAEGAAIMMDTLIKALNKQFGGAMESKMDNLSTKTSNMTIAFKQLADSVFKSGLGDFLKVLVDRLTDMANASARLVRIISGNQNVRDIIGTDAEGKDFAPSEALTRLRAEADAVQALIDRGRRRGLGDDGAIQQSRLNKLAEINDVIRDVAMGLIDTGPLIQQTFSLDEEFVKAMPQIQKRLAGLKTESELLNEEMALFNKILADPEVMKALDLTKEQITEITTQIRKELKEIDEGGDGAGGSLDVLNQVVQESVNAFSTDFVNALMSGQDALDSFKDFSRNLVSQIISTFMQLGVINKILNNIFGTDLPTGSFSADGFRLDKAGGGTVQRNTAFMVGERGPEIFVPNTGGTIMNNMNTKNALGGQAVNIYQNVNFSTGIVPTVRAEVMSMLPQIAEVTKGAVQESAMRGGSFRRSLIGG